LSATAEPGKTAATNEAAKIRNAERKCSLPPTTHQSCPAAFEGQSPVLGLHTLGACELQPEDLGRLAASPKRTPRPVAHAYPLSSGKPCRARISG
jgi:hypothetical protein